MSDRLPVSSAPADPADVSTTRRTVLRAAGLVALAGGGAATFGACAADAEPTAPVSSAPATSAPASPSTAASSSAPASPSPTASSATPSAAAPTGPSAAAADIPVGGGVILQDADYVITRPTKGEYKAFSKICTHQSCPVTEITDGAIVCPCHGSTFSIEDGSVTNPPANEPLAESKVTVSGDKVYVTV